MNSPKQSCLVAETPFTIRKSNDDHHEEFACILLCSVLTPFPEAPGRCLTKVEGQRWQGQLEESPEGVTSQSFLDYCFPLHALLTVSFFGKFHCVIKCALPLGWTEYFWRLSSTVREHLGLVSPLWCSVQCDVSSCLSKANHIIKSCPDCVK